MHHITIIRAESKHLQDIFYINQLTLPDNYPEEYFIYHFFIENNRKNYCAAVNGFICGYILLKEYKSYDEIVSFAVLREYRRMGVGRLLMEKIIQTNESEKDLVLFSYKINHVAIEFYKNMNFEEISIIKNFYGKGYDGIKFLYKKNKKVHHF